MSAKENSLLSPTDVSAVRHPATPRRRAVRTPKLRHHKATGQAYAVLNGRYLFFGAYGTPEATEQYHRAIAEWHANQCQPTKPSDQITVHELTARFWSYAQTYYRDASGQPTTEQVNLRVALRRLCELYGSANAAEFGPRALKAIRQQLIERGFCRSHINKTISRIKMVFKWAVAEELLPAGVYQALLAVRGLKKGRDGVREAEPVRPVPQEHIDAIQPYVSRQVWALVQLQLLTGARSGEIVKLRPCDLDTSGAIWTYRPEHHKTAHHGHTRVIYFGPKAQAVLRPFLLRPKRAYCFSPSEAEAERRAAQRSARQTPLSCGNAPGEHGQAEPRRTKGDVYTVSAYRRAISRAVALAFPAPAHLARQDGESVRQWQRRLTAAQRRELAAWLKRYHWHPHQLRHNAATFLRKEFGIETARIILGHRSAAITETYAELDHQKALDAVMKVG